MQGPPKEPIILIDTYFCIPGAIHSEAIHQNQIQDSRWTRVFGNLGDISEGDAGGKSPQRQLGQSSEQQKRTEQDFTCGS